jgi:hypothetical protein
MIEPLLTTVLGHLSGPEIEFEIKFYLVDVIDLVVQSRCDLGALRAGYGDAIVSASVGFPVQSYEPLKGMICSRRSSQICATSGTYGEICQVSSRARRAAGSPPFRFCWLG